MSLVSGCELIPRGKAVKPPTASGYFESLPMEIFEPIVGLVIAEEEKIWSEDWDDVAVNPEINEVGQFHDPGRTGHNQYTFINRLLAVNKTFRAVMLRLYLQRFRWKFADHARFETFLNGYQAIVPNARLLIRNIELQSTIDGNVSGIIGIVEMIHEGYVPNLQSLQVDFKVWRVTRNYERWVDQIPWRPDFTVMVRLLRRLCLKRIVILGLKDRALNDAISDCVEFQFDPYLPAGFFPENELSLEEWKRTKRREEQEQEEEEQKKRYEEWANVPSPWTIDQ